MDIAKIRKKAKEQAEADASRKASGVSRDEKETEEKVQEEKAEETAQKAPDSAPVEKELGQDAGEEISADDAEEKQSHPVIQPKPGSHAEPAASQTEQPEEDTDIVELLTFYLSNEEFAFRVSEIEEILRFQRITMVPKVPENILGITSLRGKIIPVSDLRKRLSIKGESKIDESRKKILILKGSKGPFGALIDKVKGVIRISSSEISEPPAHLSETEMTFLEGVVLHNSKFISVIRMEEVADINFKD